MSQPVAAQSVDLGVQLGPLSLKNPVLTASGTCGYALEYAPYVDLTRLGAFTTKSITPLERKGNEPARIVETRAGMLNAIGLANVGLDRFVDEKLPDVRRMGVPVFVNVAGHSIDDYLTVVRRLDPIDAVAGFELNVSCPNVSDGLVFGTDPKRLRELVAAVRAEVTRGILIVKLSPNVTDVTETAAAALDGGADVLSMVNTFVGMAVNVETWKPMLANVSGGLSGPAIKPLAVHQVNRVHRGVARDANVPIIGMGGIQTWQDAVEFLLAGATAVAVGTAMFLDPTTPIRIIEGLEAYLRRRRLSSVREIIGQLRLPASAELPAGAACD